MIPAVAASAAGPDNTWALLTPLPEHLDAPVFALAVSPADNQLLLAGTQTGALYRSHDAGQSWTPVHRDPGHPVLSLGFSPAKPGLVLAGTRGGGVLRSADYGQTWTVQPGLEKSVGRAFGFAKTFTAVGTEQGVLTVKDPGNSVSAALPSVSVTALAISALNDPSKLLAGGDATHGSEPLPLYNSADGGQTWNPVTGVATSSNMVSALAAYGGTLPPKTDTRPVLLGTNTGLYSTPDNGGTWQQLTGGGALPATDFNQVAFTAAHADRYYVASDGGGSDLGGVWSTTDAGQHFYPLRPPLPSVTALAVSADEQPWLYVATFRPADHAVMIFGFHDTGGQVQPAPPIPSAPPAAAPAATGPAVTSSWLAAFVSGPEAPYLALGVAAVAVILLAGIAYFRRGRSRRL
ncbi:MAG TPA: hypothetical protein VF160_06030 [Candidatus Dormibacteraeota bacterium]